MARPLTMASLAMASGSALCSCARESIGGVVYRVPQKSWGSRGPRWISPRDESKGKFSQEASFSRQRSCLTFELRFESKKEMLRITSYQIDLRIEMLRETLVSNFRVSNLTRY